MFRVIRVVEDWTRTTYAQWMWLEGYVLDAKGDAVEKRTPFVLREGLRIIHTTAPARLTRTDRGRAKVGSTRQSRVSGVGAGLAVGPGAAPE